MNNVNGLKNILIMPSSMYELTLSWRGFCRWWSWVSREWGRCRSGWRKSRVWPEIHSVAAGFPRSTSHTQHLRYYHTNDSCHYHMSEPYVLYLTALVTSANCMRSYFLSSWLLGMWPCQQHKHTCHITYRFPSLLWHTCAHTHADVLPTASWRAAGRWEWVSCSSDRSDDSVWRRRTDTLRLKTSTTVSLTSDTHTNTQKHVHAHTNRRWCHLV